MNFPGKIILDYYGKTMYQSVIKLEISMNFVGNCDNN